MLTREEWWKLNKNGVIDRIRENISRIDDLAFKEEKEDRVKCNRCGQKIVRDACTIKINGKSRWFCGKVCLMEEMQSRGMVVHRVLTFSETGDKGG